MKQKVAVGLSGPTPDPPVDGTVQGKRVVVGLSGGVDSAVAAALLKEQGYEVTGVHLVCFNEPGCRADQDRQDALQIALELKIPFKVLDFRKAYRDKVLGYFWSELKRGRTPNPDIICNQEIKFGLLYQWIKKQGFDLLATGHYAKIVQNLSSVILSKAKDPARMRDKFTRNFARQNLPDSSSRPSGTQNDKGISLVIPKDKTKDQTYFLYRLQSEQLKHLIFPLADLMKREVRTLARKRDLPVANKKDSTGICFIGELNIRHFLKEELGEKEGKVVDTKGKVIGKHQGHWFYTVGQRHGFTIETRSKSQGLRSKKNQSRLYVVDKDQRKNRLVVGTRDEVMRDELVVEGLNWISLKDTSEVTREVTRKTKAVRAPRRWRDKGKVFVRIRHQGELLRIKKLELRSKGKAATVFLKKPAFGIAPGQSAVFYQDDLVLGGGIIV